jgi:hypothetical protein
MILALSRPPYEAGARRKGCNDGDGKWHADQPFTILGPATQAEWIAQCVEHGVSKRDIQWQLQRTKGDTFVKVAID